ncbi:MAG TPA: hypothetical protein VNV43_07710 [Candidatus Acidoferrales bacterium]|jgi:hypothetical protein|nr:hypothetical protein [Candidatus Acidoferrales bacterium]
MEQERKIEKLLRSYAKKRRGQAGDSFKLDPATRQMLQNEISRNTPPAEDEDDTMSLWELLRRNWLFFLGFAACIFLLASLFIPKIHRSKDKATLALSAGAQSNAQDLRRIPGAVQSPLERNTLSDTNGPVLITTASPAPSSPVPTLDSVQVAARRGQLLDNDRGGAENSTATFSQVTTNLTLADNASAPTPEMTRPATENQGAIHESEKMPQPPPATTGGEYAAAPMPAGNIQTRTGEANGEPSGVFGPAAAPQPSVQNSFLNTVPSSVPSSPVLRDFAVSQNGNMIRVVDQDGSVYTGTLQVKDPGVNTGSWNSSAVAESTVQSDMAKSENQKKVESPKMVESDKLTVATPSTQAGGGGGAFGNEAPPPSQSYTFRVGGMNRTLKQSVVFTATLLEDLTVMKNAQVTFGMTANAAVGAAVAQQMVQSKGTNQMTQLQWSNLRISGTAIINRTNKIQVNALPRAPVKSSLPSQQ